MTSMRIMNRRDFLKISGGTIANLSLLGMAGVKELLAQAGDAELTYVEGYPADNSYRQDMIDQAVKISQSADVAILYIALPTFKESEGYDRKDLDLTTQQIALIKAVSKVQPNTVVVLNNGSPVVMSAWWT